MRALILILLLAVVGVGPLAAKFPFGRRKPAAAEGKPFVKSPGPLDRKILEILACTDAGNAGGVIGIHAVQLSSGRTLHEWNASQQFTPGSNTKLFSSAVALLRLGPEHRFSTRLMAEREPDSATGVLAGDLYLVGGGDPSFGARRYQTYLKNGGVVAGIDRFVEELKRRGVTRIEGSVVGDDTWYPADPYPVGWTLDDATAYFGAAVSALTLDDNAQDVLVDAETGVVRFDPPVEYFTVLPQLTRGERTRVSLEKIGVGTGRHFLMQGTVSANQSGPVSDSLPIDQPALFAAMSLHEALQRAGIAVGGTPRQRSRLDGEAPLPMPAVTLAEQKSPPLVDLLRVVNKASQNLWAELVLREVGRVAGGEGTRRNGLREVSKLLAEAGASEGCCFFQDGSGLSRQTLATPRAVTQVLQQVYQSGHREAWLSLLPVGATDGTLARRFQGREADARRIRAKTGALAHVAGLSGYAQSKTHGDVAFAILFNHYNGDGREARSVLDKIALAFTE